MVLSTGTVVVEDVVLDLHRVGEEHDHHDDRGDRVEDLERQVVARLHRDLVVAAATEVDDRVEDQRPHDHTRDQCRDPRALPEAEDVLALLGGGVRHARTAPTGRRSRTNSRRAAGHRCPRRPGWSPDELSRSSRPHSWGVADSTPEPLSQRSRTPRTLSESPLGVTAGGPVGSACDKCRGRSGATRAPSTSTPPPPSRCTRPPARPCWPRSRGGTPTRAGCMVRPATHACCSTTRVRSSPSAWACVPTRSASPPRAPTPSTAVFSGCVAPAHEDRPLRGRALRRAARSTLDRHRAGRASRRPARAGHDLGPGRRRRRGRPGGQPRGRHDPAGRRARAGRRTPLRRRVRVDGPRRPAHRLVRTGRVGAQVGRSGRCRRPRGPQGHALAQSLPGRRPGRRAHHRVRERPGRPGRRRRPARGRRGARPGGRPSAGTHRPDPRSRGRRSPTSRWSAIPSTDSPTW